MRDSFCERAPNPGYAPSWRRFCTQPQARAPNPPPQRQTAPQVQRLDSPHQDDEVGEMLELFCSATKHVLLGAINDEVDGELGETLEDVAEN